VAADYEALEARVADLEQQIRHVLPAKIDAVAYGLSLMHEDVRAIRGEHGAMLELQREALRRVAETQAQHGQALAEILRRLPPAED
jgi:Flp pilus assembly protein TadB